MTLQDILGRDVRVEWHEAVAVVRDVAEQLALHPDSKTVPHFHQIEILPHGEVALGGGDPVHDTAEALGQVLQALLSRADPPVQLRLLIAQAQDSVGSFAESLGFFERPDRTAVLQGLYNRSSAALPLAGVDAVTPTFAAIEEPDAELPELDSSRHSRRKLLYGVALMAVLSAAGAAALYAARAEGSSNDGAGIGARVSNGVSTVTSAVGSAVSKISERVGLGAAAVPPAPVEAPAAATATVKGPKPKRSTKADPRSSVSELALSTLAAFDLNPAEPAPVVPKETVIVVAQPERSSTGEGVTAGEGVVYSSSSRDVSAPVGLRPQLPKEMPPGVRAEDLTRIELVILPDGTVESVKLLDRPKDIHAFMLLSAAKAWQFRPAMRDGVPVRYRKTIWVAR